MDRYVKTFVEHFNEQPTSILEIGSRDADHAHWMRTQADPYIEPHLVNIVEPHPECYRNIIAKYPDYRVFELAVSDEPGVVNFNAIPMEWGPDSVGTSSLLTMNEHPDEGVTLKRPQRWVKVLAVTGRTILQLIDRWQIDLVKIDVEGFSWQVLNSFGPDIRLLRSIHIEVEVAPFQLWENQKSYQDCQYLLTSWGFRELYYQPLWWSGRQGDSVWVRID